MKISVRQKILFFAFFILGGNCLITYTFYKSNQKTLDSQQWVQHTETVIYQSANILSLSTDLETSARGFVLTNDSSFLEPFFNAEKKIFINLAQLKQLTSDNTPQQLRIDTLRLCIHKRLDFSRQSINLRNKQGLDSAIVYTSTKMGKYYSDQIRRIINAIQREENILLQERKQINERSIKVLNYFPPILFILMVLLAVLLLIGTNKYLLQNKEKEKHAEELVLANKELVFQNQEKEKRAAELIIANNDVIERTKQLESANKELESFSYSVSHDLRAPLRAVDGYARILEEDYNAVFDEEGKRLLKQVQKNAAKMGALIDDLLAFSRLGRKELKRSDINMNNLVETVLAEIKQTVSFNGEVKFKDLLPVMADHSLMPHVITNLLSNAIKYSSTKEKPVIEITSKKENGSTIYSFKDNGVGFDMQYEHKLFGVFQRLHSSEEFEGTGVGLAIVHRIILKHQGKIWAKGTIDEGATFSFSLPDMI